MSSTPPFFRVRVGEDVCGTSSESTGDGPKANPRAEPGGASGTLFGGGTSLYELAAGSTASVSAAADFPLRLVGKARYC